MLYNTLKLLACSYTVDLITDSMFSLAMIKITLSARLSHLAGARCFTTSIFIFTYRPRFSYPEASKELGTEQHDKYSTVRATEAKSIYFIGIHRFLPPSAQHITTWCLLPLPHYFYLLLDTVSLHVTSRKGEEETQREREMLSFIYSVG